MPLPVLKAFGFEIPLTRWGVAGLSAVAVCGVALVVYQKTVDDPQKVIYTLKQVNEQYAAEHEEYGRHVFDEPVKKHEFFEDTDGKIALRVFADHCVLIQWRVRDAVLTRLIPDPKAGMVHKAQWRMPSLLPVLTAGPACNRGCLNPHPNTWGNFRWRYGRRSGDWVEVIREWPDGCAHIQMLHLPSNSFATNQDGTPNVKWTCCVH